MTLDEFSNTIKNVKGKRVYKINNSYGIYDGFKYYRKIKPKDSKYNIAESQYFKITRIINNKLRELLSNGEDIILPNRMGKLEIRKYNSYIKLIDDKIKTNLPIDWNKTIKFWYQNEEAYKNKTLIKAEEKEIYKICYNRGIANYKNQIFYQFKINRQLKLKLKQNIKDNKIDAYIL